MGVAALILAAGSGSRMKMNTTKQKIVLNGQSVLLRTVSVFDSSDTVDSITVVVRSEEVDFAKQELSGIGKLHKRVHFALDFPNVAQCLNREKRYGNIPFFFHIV